MVFTPQNHINQERIYPLPETQVDRFLMKFKIENPDMEQQQEILHAMDKCQPNVDVQIVINLETVPASRKNSMKCL
jgi:MoxR-like ATPase